MPEYENPLFMSNFKVFSGRKPVPAKDRFELCSVPVPECGCWIWFGSATSDGCGRFKANGKIIRTSRYSYLLHKGPIPPGMIVCHTCNTPSCVNPDHLFLAGKKRSHEKRKLQKYGSKHHRSKLTEKQVKAIRADNRSQKSIADEYEVSQPLIQNIKTRQIWRHI